MNRILIATVLGVIAGFVCALAGATMGVKITTATLVWILLNRAVLGFVIGASGLKIHWAWHGALMGLIVGSIFSYAAFLFESSAAVIAATLLASIVFGFLIDLFTTVVFKQPQQLPAAEAPVEKRAAA